ncbi:MAG TPA: methyltransferase domain-containing protein [Nevskiaceae bacterium]|nr:methyltransferase domain-containing protein [Nevskiaceae bacterium]
MAVTRFSRGGLPLTRHALATWLASPRGRRVMDMEQAEMRRLLPDVFGRHVLQIGSWGQQGELIGGAETLHRAVLATVRDDACASAVIDPENLPLPANSVDAVILPHSQEFARSPHNVLREASRVLNERGKLFVFGFSPWSGWALLRLLGFGYRAFPSGARFHGAGRICDWLELLDFEITEVRRFGTGFPWLKSRSEGEAWNLANLVYPFAEAYLLVAKKRVLPMNFVGRVQRAQVRPLVGVPVPAPGAQSRANCEQPDS